MNRSHQTAVGIRNDLIESQSQAPTERLLDDASKAW